MHILEGQMLILSQTLLCSMGSKIEVEPCRSSMSVIGTADHCCTPTYTSSLTRPMCMMLGLESDISSMTSTVVPLVRKGTAGLCHERRARSCLLLMPC